MRTEAFSDSEGVAEAPSASPSTVPPSEHASSDVLIDIRGLRKTFRIGFWGRRVEAVKGICLAVRRGEIFGFLGPNGAGKTTTLKMLTGLIAPTAGAAFLFGQRVPSPAARERIGFLPENPYVYPYLTPREFVELSGSLSGMRGERLRRRTLEVLAQVKIDYAADRPARRLSKGMLQRTGLAAALVADPEMLILDEPMSGLDPVGRKEVKELILSERARGRTILFSTHILSDVEAMCDRVAILREGKVVVSGALPTLLRGEALGVEITLGGADESLCDVFAGEGFTVTRRPDGVVIGIEGDTRVSQVLTTALAKGARVIEVARRRETLEDLFMKKAL